MSLEIDPKLLEELTEEERSAMNNFIAAAELGLEQDLDKIVDAARIYKLAIGLMLETRRFFGEVLTRAEKDG